MNPGLIPLNEVDLLTAINNNCKDSNGYDTCSSYKFSVENIVNSAFKNNSNLTKVTFMGASDNTNKLKTIDSYAFRYCNLTYTIESPLLLPSSLTYVGDSAFNSNSNLISISFNGNYSSFEIYWNGNALVNGLNINN